MQNCCIPCASGPASEVPELEQGRKLLRVLEKWLRSNLETSLPEEAVRDCNPSAEAMT